MSREEIRTLIVKKTTDGVVVELDRPTRVTGKLADPAPKTPALVKKEEATPTVEATPS